MITRAVLITFVTVVGLAGPPTVFADQPCEVVPMPCTFEGRPFRVIVVDSETRQPLEGVHALAEWKTHGFYGSGGPLMVQDAVSGPDGVIAFPGWGPVDGPVAGLVVGYDPGITLFKPGYLVLALPNTGPVGDGVKTRVRRFLQDGKTFEMWPLSGSPERWAYELSKATRALAGPMADELRLKFREPYLRRLYRVRSEREKLPQPVRSDRQYFGLLDGYLRLLETNR